MGSAVGLGASLPSGTVVQVDGSGNLPTGFFGSMASPDATPNEGAPESHRGLGFSARFRSGPIWDIRLLTCYAVNGDTRFSPMKRRFKMIRDNADFKVINAVFPRIAEKLEFLWGDAGFNRLMDDLQQGNRDGHRAGFPPDVLMALFGLASAHDSAFPKLARKEKDLWNLSKAR